MIGAGGLSADFARGIFALVAGILGTWVKLYIVHLINNFLSQKNRK